MPFSNRDKPRLSERLRGKSSQEFIDEINSAFGSRSPRMLFDTPQWSTRANFPRGFPFDDDSDDEAQSSRFRNRNRGERPAQSSRDFFGRQPFAEPKGVHEPPCGDERQPKKRVVEPQQRPPPSLNHHGLRNTVPLAQAPKSERSGRAMSAPPGDRTLPRYTTTCEIPVMGIRSSAPKPPSNQQQPPPQQQQQQQQQPNNVRVIPIQVEGRDEPLINSDIDTSTHFPAEPSKFEGRTPRDFGSFQKHSTRFQPQPQPQPQQQQQHAASPSPHPQQHSAPNISKESVDEPDKGPPCHPPTAPVDPVAQAIARINEIQNKIDELAKQVENAQITSRKDKQYVVLDEMLTVQLLHLDNVDPEGHDNVRQARKDAIRAIQKCISILESKVPGEPMDVDVAPPLDAEPEPMVEEKPTQTPTDADATNAGTTVPQPVVDQPDPLANTPQHFSPAADPPA